MKSTVEKGLANIWIDLQILIKADDGGHKLNNKDKEKSAPLSQWNVQ